MKNTSLERKDTSLLLVLQGHFNGELNLARVKLICLFITAIYKIKTINYDRLASGFYVKADKIVLIGESNALLKNLIFR